MDFFTTVGRSEQPFQVYIGGRGIGKTYSTLADIAENKKFFLYVRLQLTEIEICCTKDGNPFKKINSDKGFEIYPTLKKKDGIAKFFDGEELVGYGAPLSTFSNLRGFDLSNVDIIIFDEFMKEGKKTSVVKNAGLTLLNLYESVNRNRELFGQPPTKMILLSNAMNLADDILLTLKLIRPIEHMLKKNQSRFTDRERGLYLEFIKDSPISKAKENTALYKLMNGSQFNEHALNNKFINADMQDCIKKVQISEFFPYIHIAGITIHKHKSNGSIHITMSNAKARYVLEDFEVEKLRLIFAPEFRYLGALSQITYDNYQTKMIFTALIKNKI